jgi:hypothetical protein
MAACASRATQTEHSQIPAAAKDSREPGGIQRIDLKSHSRQRLCKKDLWPVSKSVKGEKKESKTAKSDIKSQPEQRREC